MEKLGISLETYEKIVVWDKNKITRLLFTEAANCEVKDELDVMSLRISLCDNLQDQDESV